MMTSSQTPFTQGKTYTGMLQFDTFEERFNYLALDGVIGEDTLGFMRYFAQRWYASPEWKQLRDKIILRDNGCELGVPGWTIFGKVYVHHIEPITRLDIQNMSSKLRNPDNLVCCSYDVHQAIHYGNLDRLPTTLVERKPNDTCPWKN